ncbi:MAG: PAS domain S-box protein [Deltaproteobacteria bacterium]|nr:PAS domain S-box protein [Deltaproteobacteria bacterium]
MKKLIITVIVIFCLINTLVGAYVIVSMEDATSKLNYVISLHQIEILREHLLLYLKKVQSDLGLKNTLHESSIDTIVQNVRYLDNMMGRCMACHQSPKMLKGDNAGSRHSVLSRLYGLQNEIDQYKKSLSRYLTIRAGRDRTAIEFNQAFRTAEQLVTEVNTMVHATSAKLAERTESSYKDISRTKNLLYGLVVLGPIVAAVVGFIFIKKITGPVNTLVQATRKITGGDLDNKIEGLKGEFGEVAASFNEMSDSLKDHMHRIQESENRYRTLFESAGDAIFIVEAEGKEPGRIVDANPAAAEMHGYTLEELLELNLVKDLDAPNAAKEAPDRIEHILKGEWIKAEIDHLKKDGSIFPVEISAGLLEYMNRKYILAVDRDISERKKMENLILQTKIEWEDTFDTITDMITIHDKEFNIIRANKAAQEILGLPFLETTRAVKCYAYYHGKDSPPRDCQSCTCLNTGQPTSFETFEPHLNKYLEVRAMPRFDNNNEIIGIIHVIRDITERKKVEEILQRAEQMKMVGEWATGLVHEIKNPLAGIKGSVEMLASDASMEEEDRAIITQAVDEIKRIEMLLKSLLNFAKPPKPQLTLVDINDILDKSIAFALRHPSVVANSSSAINVFKDFDPKIPKAMADPMQMQQVFLNLLLNAIEAMPDGGILATKTYYDDKLDSIQITISDTGKGMDKSLISKVFQPFFTTKRKGSGLGLSITRRLIEQHGGHIDVESDPGKGTVFDIFLNVNGKRKDQG